MWSDNFKINKILKIFNLRLVKFSSRAQIIKGKIVPRRQFFSILYGDVKVPVEEAFFKQEAVVSWFKEMKK